MFGSAIRDPYTMPPEPPKLTVSYRDIADEKFAPNLQRVEQLFEGLLTICGLQKPIQQGWPTTCELKADRSSTRGNAVEELKEKGTDALGCYLYQTERDPARDYAEAIVLYLSSCAEVAKDLSLNLQHVIEIVLLHEGGHYVTHFGRQEDHSASGWLPFRDANDEELCEQVAQISTYLYLCQNGDKAMLDCFEKLAAKSPPIYQLAKTWTSSRQDQNCFHSAIELLRSVLRRDRKDVWREEKMSDIYDIDE